MKPYAFSNMNILMITIERLLKCSDNPLDPYSQIYLKLVYKHLESFEELAKSTLETPLDSEINQEVGKLDGIVEEIKSKSKRNEDLVEFSINRLGNLIKQCINFNHRLKILEQRYADGVYNSYPEEEEDEEEEEVDRDVVSSKMIGMHDVYKELKEKLMSSPVTSLIGMPGVGKTTLANKVFHDPKIVEHFDHRVWVRVGKKGRVRNISRCILAGMGVKMIPGEDEDAANMYLKARLQNKRYLIVLDDVWDRFMMYLLHPHKRYERNKLNHPFLHSKSGSRILLTSRLQQLDDYVLEMNIGGIVQMRLMNKQESWDLLCDKVFCEGPCPPQLEKAGKMISKNCEGLPLTILTVARLLCNEKRITLEYWNEVAAKKNHQLFLNAYNEISKVLLPSYTYLPRILQMCFLYIGLFPQNYEIPRSKLINLWFADRFLESSININSYDDALGCLEEVVSNSVVMVYQKCTYNFTHTVKTCGLHSSLWHLSKQKVRETKFALVLDSPNDCLEDGMKGHPRLSIRTNVLFGMKDVHKSVEENCASSTHSLLCFGPYHQYQVPLCFRLNLLRELDALSIRFYEFPMEVLQLVQLTYLSLTLNGMIPASISQLQFLEFFIIDRHQSIKSSKDTSYLPVEIWSLQVLKHLQVMGRDLPDPCGASLGSLIKLLNVSARSCTAAVLKGLPNVKELTIRIELAPDGDGKPLGYFDHIYQLDRIDKLKCVIVNPEIVRPVAPFISCPGDYLYKLSLSGLGYPWKEMRKIAQLPHLAILKLKNYAFQGPEWEVEETRFTSLTTLLIEDTDIVDWKFGSGAFPILISLTMRSCYKFEKLHGEFTYRLDQIELVDCNPSCVVEMKKAIPNEAQLNICSSWDHGKLKT